METNNTELYKDRINNSNYLYCNASYKKYRLKRDFPDLKEGAIFNFNYDKGQWECRVGRKLYSYKLDDIRNKDWFEPIREKEYSCQDIWEFALWYQNDFQGVLQSSEKMVELWLSKR